MEKIKCAIVGFCVFWMLCTGSILGGSIVEQDNTIVEPSLRLGQNIQNPSDFTTMKTDVSTISYSTLHNVQRLTDEDVQITFAPGFDLNPTITNDNTGDLILGYLGDPAGDGVYNVWFTSSIDQGATWLNDNSMGLVVPTPEKPSVDHWSDTRFFGTYVPNPTDYDGSAMYVIEINNPAQLDDGFDAVYWTWFDVGDGYTDFIDVSLACDNAVEDYAWGAISIVGDHGSGLSGVPMFSYQCNEGGTAWIYYFSDVDNDTIYGDCQGASMDIDPVTHESYSIWNFVNTTTDLHDIYFTKFDFATWDEFSGNPIHPFLVDGVFSSGNDDLNVDISANNDNIIIVTQSDDDILCYYSNDGMETISTSVVVSTSADELYPKVVHTDDMSAVCLFVSGENVYTLSTQDGGATWGTPVQINDEDGTVVEADANTDLCKIGAVWTDDRTGDSNIFFDTPGVAVPIVNVVDISGGFGVSATVENTGTADAENVPWSITIEGGLMLIGAETIGEIPTLAVDSSEDITTGLILGFGQVDITVTAGESQQTASGTVILPFVLGVE
jgi:hypothetical protein